MKECTSGQCTIGSSEGTGASRGGTCSCGCGCSCECGSSCECCDKSGAFLSLAKEAHHELLKQKMKAAFEAKIGKKMDKVADLVVTTALACMQSHMAEKQSHETFENKLMDIFKG